MRCGGIRVSRCQEGAPNPGEPTLTCPVLRFSFRDPVPGQICALVVFDAQCLGPEERQDCLRPGSAPAGYECMKRPFASIALALCNQTFKLSRAVPGQSLRNIHISQRCARLRNPCTAGLGDKGVTKYCGDGGVEALLGRTTLEEGRKEGRREELGLFVPCQIAPVGPDLLVLLCKRPACNDGLRARAAPTRHTCVSLEVGTECANLVGFQWSSSLLPDLCPLCVP